MIVRELEESRELVVAVECCSELEWEGEMMEVVVVEWKCLGRQHM